MIVMLMLMVPATSTVEIVISIVVTTALEIRWVVESVMQMPMFPFIFIQITEHV